jgi:hypothetical protein
MDMTIAIEGDKIVTSQFAKKLALHLYTPPASCQAPGIITVLVYGMTLRIFQLCSKEKDIDEELYLLMRRLLDRGYNTARITLIFSKAISNAQKYLTTNEWKRLEQKKKKLNTTKKQIYFHLPFHPSHPMPAVKRAWQTMVYQPPGKRKLNNLTNTQGEPISVNRMIMCYSRSPNIGNMLSCRKIDKRSGPKVSSYVD